MRLPPTAWGALCMCEARAAVDALVSVDAGGVTNAYGSALGRLDAVLVEWELGLAGAAWETRLAASHCVHVCAAMLYRAGCVTSADLGGGEDGVTSVMGSVAAVLRRTVSFCVRQAESDARFPQLRHAAVWCVARAIGAPAVLPEDWKCDSGSLGEHVARTLRESRGGGGTAQSDGVGDAPDVGKCLREWASVADGRLGGLARGLSSLL